MPALDEPLKPAAAKRLIRGIIQAGTVSLSKHAQEEMTKDDLNLVDCVNILRGGVVAPGELERGSWRYRVSTPRICVVVAFRSDVELVIVTAWRSPQ
jgi:hypothetical protein